MTYQIDPQHTTVQFKVRHLMIAYVRGVFAKFSGSVDFDPANPGATRIDVTIDAASIATPEAARNEHLKGADFFDTANHPAMTFRSKSVAAAGEGAYNVTGDFTLRGVTKDVTLRVQNVTGETKDPWGNLRRGCEASARISRKDFGMTFNAPLESGGVLVSDEVDITLDVEMMRKP
jgi:polyisoprenoid-binding protein YceI